MTPARILLALILLALIGAGFVAWQIVGAARWLAGVMSL